MQGTTQESQLLQSRLSSFPTFEEHGTLFITSILAREIGWFERGVKEATHVKLECPSLNRGGWLSSTWNELSSLPRQIYTDSNLNNHETLTSYDLSDPDSARQRVKNMYYPPVNWTDEAFQVRVEMSLRTSSESSCFHSALKQGYLSVVF